MTRIDDLDFAHTLVAHSGPPPWLGAVVRTSEPLTADGIASFGRFDHPDGPTYVYVLSTAAWSRAGHVGASAWIYLVSGGAKAKKPPRRASRIRRLSLPSEIVVSDDLALAVPLEQLGLDRWTERAS